MNNSLSLKTRREFLQGSLLAGSLSWTIPAFLSRTITTLHADPAAATMGRNILVLVQLAGGNDGLNTVVPFTNDHYYKARPNLGIRAPQVLKLNDEVGLHPALTGLKDLHASGQLAVWQGVGYPNPNRSHFRSTEIWQTASASEINEKHGWLGRYFDHACAGAEPTVGVSVGRQSPQSFAGPKPLGVSLEQPETYRFADTDPAQGNMASGESFYRHLNRPDMLDSGGEQNTGGTVGAVAGAFATQQSPLDFLERTALDAQVSSDRIRALNKSSLNRVPYPVSALSNQLKLVARLIGGGLPTRVFYVSQGGYDTHTNQSGSHDRLLGELGSAIKAFNEDIKAQGNLDRVMLMTFSEFGRRVKQNANGGTDHGAAAPLFMVGSKLRQGVHGMAPDLAPDNLKNGDLKFTTDFRSLYAGVIEQWLGAESKSILKWSGPAARIT